MIVRTINRAILDNANGRGPNVYYHGSHSKHPARIYDCRSRKGIVQVRFLETGVWVPLDAAARVAAGDTILQWRQDAKV